MGLQEQSSAAFSERLRFTSLREAQAIWRVLQGENMQTVSADLDVPVTILLPWLEESEKVRDSRDKAADVPLSTNPLRDSGQVVLSSS